MRKDTDMNLLLLHGNGGARTRFRQFLQIHERQEKPPFKVYLPALPGFEGRPLPERADWSTFTQVLARTVMQDPEGDWVLYGHGIGGSLLLHWAAQGYDLPQGSFSPRRVILNSCIGATLEHRWFPRLMSSKGVRRTLQRLVASPTLRPLWERRLFLHPRQIDPELRRQFFADYAQCASFSLWFDLITPAWYKTVQPRVQEQLFYFLWGDKERVVSSKLLHYWQKDFPNATFDLREGWDHFPMMDQPTEFYQTLSTILETESVR